jgi:hypothetical protein
VNRPRGTGPVALLALAALAAGCAATAPRPAPAPGAAATSVVLLPLENLSGRAEYGDRLTRIVWTEVGASGRWDLVEPAEADAAIVEARVRTSLSMTRDQVQKVAQRSGARWLLAGTIIECGTARTPDGEVPTVSLALRLVDGRSGRVRWTDMRSRSGEDHETVFGWGRVTNLERLAQETARDLVAAIRLPAEPDTLAPGGK